jgi:hypothetical protein
VPRETSDNNIDDSLSWKIIQTTRCHCTTARLSLPTDFESDEWLLAYPCCIRYLYIRYRTDTSGYCMGLERRIGVIRGTNVGPIPCIGRASVYHFWACNAWRKTNEIDPCKNECVAVTFCSARINTTRQYSDCLVIFFLRVARCVPFLSGDNAAQYQT